MFFESIVREDRSIIDLLNGDYTFVNERLAAHYGIPNIYGSQFRRVKLDGALDVRRGLLGKGGIELVTSVSDRTSPVQRGKWVMTNILGIVPPDPPPNVPALKEASAGGNGPQTMRQQMEAHRANPACAGCHKMMDPIGFALENFDGIGKWRTKEAGQKVDASGQLTDGTKIDRAWWICATRCCAIRRNLRATVTEKLLTYALGRGVEYQDMPVVRAIVRDAARNDYRFSSLVEGIVKSEPFQMNRKPEATAPSSRARDNEGGNTNVYYRETHSEAGDAAGAGRFLGAAVAGFDDTGAAAAGQGGGASEGSAIRRHLQPAWMGAGVLAVSAARRAHRVSVRSEADRSVARTHHGDQRPGRHVVHASAGNGGRRSLAQRGGVQRRAAQENRQRRHLSGHHHRSDDRAEAWAG